MAKPPIEYRPNRKAVKSTPVAILSPIKAVIAPDPVLEQPPADKKDLGAIRTKLKALLTKSEAKQLDAFFDRLDKANAQNRKNQKAWREKQKAK